jgi:hypothetical protein
MSEVQMKPAVLPGGGKVTMRVHVRGRVIGCRRYDGKIFTTFVCPAPDAYSKPSNVEVRSKARFAEIGEEVGCDCVLGGYEGRKGTVTDKNTGEVRDFRPVVHTLDLVE